MQQILEQLDRLRRQGRQALLATRAAQFLAAALIIALSAGVMDYLLRLPGWIRLLLGLVVVVVAAVWLVTRISRALRFNPDLSLIAQRLEAKYPKLAGRLASPVAFAEHPEHYHDPSRTHALAQQSISDLLAFLQHTRLPAMLNTQRLRRFGGLAAAALIVFLAVVASQPNASYLAAQRWLMPMADVAWPKRVNLASAVDQDVWPDDTELRLATRVEKGYHDGMRVWLAYRLSVPGEGSTGWEKVLMSQQRAAAEGREAVYERLVDLPRVLAQVRSRAGEGDGKQAVPEVEFYFESGDDRTDPRTLRLVSRPSVITVRAELTPPEYAQAVVSPQRVALDQQAGPVATAAALQGSSVRLRIGLSKPVALKAAEQAGKRALADLMPGLAEMPAARVSRPDDASNAAPSDRIDVGFTLAQTAQSPIRLTDDHGLSNQGERRYRFEAVPDKEPVVSMLQPAADESVLPTAVVDLRAMARDDVAVRDLALRATYPKRVEATAEPQEHTAELARAAEPRSELALAHRLELEPLKLQPGDEVVIEAVGRDFFELDGQTHDPVVSAPRRLRIIDPATLIGQIRNELAGLRQQAVRLAGRQSELGEQTAEDPEAARTPQDQLARNVASQQNLVEGLQERAERNNLDDPRLDELLNRSDELLQQARDRAENASETLKQSERLSDEQKQQARRAQQQAAAALTELASLLDQGKDALTLQLQLRQLRTEQEAVAQEARALMPQTLGRERDQLDEQQREQVDDLAERQNALAEQAQALAEQMRATAQRMREDPSADQPTASALEQAAQTAQQQRLARQMQQAAEQARDNQLAQAGEQQAGAQQTIDQMLQQLQDQPEQRRQEMLRRRLMELAQLIERLIRQQRAQIDQLAAAEQLGPLVEPQSRLRRNTLSAHEQAKAKPDTAPVATPINKAVMHQGEAIQALRQDSRPDSLNRQQDAVGALEAALARLRELQDQAQQEQQQEQRAKLQQQYLALAEQQQSLRQQTAEHVGDEPLDRAQRRAVIELGREQDAIRDQAQTELRPQVEDHQMFVYLHDQVDELTSRLAAELRGARLSEQVLGDQDRIERYFRKMAAALEQAQAQSEFARPNQGGGGGGGGGGQQPNMVPPVAQLKLLRELAEQTLSEMQELESDPPADRRVRNQTIRRLSRMQRDLSDLGRELIRQQRQRMQQYQQQMEQNQP